MKVIIEIDIGENGEQCRKHTLEHLLHFVQGIASQGPMSEHGPFVEEGAKWHEAFPGNDAAMIYAEGIEPSGSLEEAGKYIASNPPIIMRMLISNQHFETKSLIPEDDSDVVTTDGNGEVTSVTPKKEFLENEIRH